MNQLTNILEGILDTDLDIKLTYGDLYEFEPDFGQRAPSDFKGYAWDKDGFWSQYEGVRNSWTDNKYIARKNPIRLRYLKSDIRHGFAMFILTRPIEEPMDQRAVDGYVRQMNEWCDQNKLEIGVHVKKLSNGFEFAMWNIKILGEPNKSFMGKFTIKRKAMTEGLLDKDFDIKDDDISIGKAYSITHNNYEVLCPLLEPMFQRACKSFMNHKPVVPEHTVNSGYGEGNPCRYFIDWLAAQPVGMLNDEEFTAHKPQLQEAFNTWINNRWFTITMVKFMKKKTIYFNYHKNQILRVSFG